MTDARELVEVTQADRDAAAEYMTAVSLLQGHEPSRVHALFKTEECDDFPIVQAFARHRTRALTSDGTGDDPSARKEGK